MRTQLNFKLQASNNKEGRFFSLDKTAESALRWRKIGEFSSFPSFFRQHSCTFFWVWGHVWTSCVVGGRLRQPHTTQQGLRQGGLAPLDYVPCTTTQRSRTHFFLSPQLQAAAARHRTNAHIEGWRRNEMKWFAYTPYTGIRSLQMLSASKFN